MVVNLSKKKSERLCYRTCGGSETTIKTPPQPQDCKMLAMAQIHHNPKDTTIEQLVPIFLSLLKDEFPDVCLNISANLIKSIRLGTHLGMENRS
ncbi:hypothetical protein RHMOL_Rhmol13G0209800 [Rhododendron molle]|uniref:Uncharacterized protein n=1 Tax=Rhododendron molle TaxID=49168 RepID=A0ACC0L8Z6_RHOML|nr:hypothetical protein RHMOL_Rhmol13G0209800 [Rhododendron molle]